MTPLFPFFCIKKIYLCLHPRQKKIHPFASVWYEIKGHWPNIKHVKSHTYSLGLQAPNRYESDLSNEVLYALVGQKAAKISEVKVGGQKKSARSARPRVHQSRIWLSRQFFIDLQLWPLIFLQPLDLATRAHSTSFERSDLYLFGDWKPRSWHDF